MVVIVKMDGQRIKQFDDQFKAKRWANRFCKGQTEIVILTETALPAACKARHPMEDMPDLRYRPFII